MNETLPRHFFFSERSKQFLGPGTCRNDVEELEFTHARQVPAGMTHKIPAAAGTACVRTLQRRSDAEDDTLYSARHALL